MDIKELANRAAMPVRNIRYLITEGFVDRPNLDQGRANATYGERHLEQIRLYQTLRDAGLSQREISQRIEGRSASDVFAEVDEVVRRIGPGIELKVTGSLVPNDLDIEEAVARVRSVLESVKQGKSVSSAKRKGKRHAHAEDR
jgi:DNA-binding transcriptional MerR regulator